jgi:hypothetical protein
MESSTGAEASTVCDRVERLRDVSRLILDAIERDDLPAMQRHVNESETLIAMIGAGLAERRTEAAGDSRSILDHIRRMNASMVDRLRSRQADVLDEIGRARAMWHRVQDHPDAGDGAADGFDRES